VQILLHEGGPTLFGQFLAAEAVDELFLTLSPQIASRAARTNRPGIVQGVEFAPNSAWRTEENVWSRSSGATISCSQSPSSPSAPGLCGVAMSLGQLIFFRVMQGLAGGGLQPSSQAILLDSFPPQKQGAAQTLFGVAALLAPVVGPTVGGYITDEYSWRWIFYINLPVGALALFLCWLMVQDPEYLREHRKELKKQPLNFDFIGLSISPSAITGKSLPSRRVTTQENEAAALQHAIRPRDFCRCKAVGT